jgi:hypothetical protein
MVHTLGGAGNKRGRGRLLLQASKDYVVEKAKGQLLFVLSLYKLYAAVRIADLSGGKLSEKLLLEGIRFTPSYGGVRFENSPNDKSWLKKICRGIERINISMSEYICLQ